MPSSQDYPARRREQPKQPLAQPGVQHTPPPSALPAPWVTPVLGLELGTLLGLRIMAAPSPAGPFFPCSAWWFRGRSLSPARSVPEVPDELPAWAQGPVCLLSCPPPSVYNAGHPLGVWLQGAVIILKLVT